MRGLIPFTGLLLLPLALEGCFTPGSGPQIEAVYANAVTQEGEVIRPNYELIEYSSPILEILRRRSSDSLFGHFGGGRLGPSQVTIGIGDLVGLSVYEASAGGLFTPAATDTIRQGNYVNFPQQVVEQDGTISVPYAGRIMAKGKTTRQLEQDIVNQLKTRAVEPQIVVSLVDSRSSLFSVLGEAQRPGSFPVNWAGQKLLAGIALAGGPKWADYETSITINRGGKTATAMMQNVVADPRENIFLRPGDSVFLRREPRFYTALGAAGKSGHYPIDVPKITLAEAVGRAQGLLDTQADPTGVFLLRWEKRQALEKVGRQVASYTTPTIPTIYHFDLRDPNHLLASQQIDVINSDVIYISNAPTVELRKTLQVLADLSYITLNAAQTSFVLHY